MKKSGNVIEIFHKKSQRIQSTPGTHYWFQSVVYFVSFAALCDALNYASTIELFFVSPCINATLLLMNSVKLFPFNIPCESKAKSARL